MKWGNWYVVDVSHFKGNSVHRTIVQCINEDPLMVEFVGYEDKFRKSVDRLEYFNVVKHIEEMNSEPGH